MLNRTPASQRIPALKQLDFRPQSIKLQLNARHACQLIVQQEIDFINLSSDGRFHEGLTVRCPVRFACNLDRCSTLGSQFHA